MKKLNRILYQKSNIQTKYNDILETDEICLTKEIKQSKESLINDNFPLKDINAVAEFEKLLQNKTFTVSEVVGFVKSNCTFRRSCTSN